MSDFELTPLQHRMIEGLQAHDRALLLTPSGSGRRTAVVHALPEGPVVWITSRNLVPILEGYFKRFRPDLPVTFVTRESLSSTPPETIVVAGATLVVGASAGAWLGRGSARANAVRRLAGAAPRVWGHSGTLTPVSGQDEQVTLARVKNDLGFQPAPLQPFEGVLSLGWSSLRSEPPKFDPEPLLKPIDLDEITSSP
jgi:hypothetical protein